MARFVVLVALATLLAVAAASKSSFHGKCPIHLGKYPFDPSKAAGQWYIAAGTPLFGEELSRCARFTITPRQPSAYELAYDITYNALSPRDGKPYGLESKAAARPHRGSLSLGAWRLIGTQEYSEPIAQSLVMTDYEGFALFLACRPVFDSKTMTFQRQYAAQVWSRQPTMDESQRTALMSILSSFDVDPSDIKIADQSNCDYSY